MMQEENLWEGAIEQWDRRAIDFGIEVETKVRENKWAEKKRNRQNCERTGTSKTQGCNQDITFLGANMCFHSPLVAGTLKKKKNTHQFAFYSCGVQGDTVA